MAESRAKSEPKAEPKPAAKKADEPDLGGHYEFDKVTGDNRWIADEPEVPDK